MKYPQKTHTPGLTQNDNLVHLAHASCILTSRCWRIAGNIIIFALCLSLVASKTCAQTNAPSSGFTQSFNPAVSLITLTPPPGAGLYHMGDSIGIQTSNNTPIRVMNIGGSLVYSGAVTTLHLPVGHYFVETPGDRTQFVVLPADFGNLDMMGVHGTGDWLYQDTLNTAVGAAWDRNGSGWEDVQAQSNTWDWTTSDAHLAVAEATGRKIVYLGASVVPAWLDPNSSQYVTNLITAYTNFVAAAMTRYSTNIYAWEIFNEPGLYSLQLGTNWNAIAPIYLALAQATKVIRDRIAPSIKLVGPSWNSVLWTTGDNQWLHDHGIDGILDMWSWHDYDSNFHAPDQDYSAETPPCGALTHRLLDTMGTNIPSKPSFIGEMGLYGTSALGCPPPNPADSVVYQSGLSWYRGFCRAIKLATMYRAQGVVGLSLQVGTLFVNYPSDNEEIYGFDQGAAGAALPRGPHPKTSAFLMTAYWLNHATFVDYRSLGTNIFLYAWTRPDNTALVVAWTVEGSVAAVGTNALTVTDIYGSSTNVSSLTETPVLFHSSTVSAAALLSNVMGILPSLNLPPVLAPLGNQSVLKNQLLQFTISATDPDNDPLTYSASPLPTGASLNPTTGVFSWTPTVSQLGAYPLTVTVTDARGLSVSTTTLISVLGSSTDGLVNWWKFDETSGTVAADSAGTNTDTLLNFNFTSTSGWTPGRIGNALAFDGVNDYVSLDSTKLALTNNFSVSSWLNPRSGTGQGVFFCVRSAYAASGFRFWLNSNALMLEGQTTTGWKQTYFALGQIPTNGWFHVVVVYDKSTLNVYVNGVNMAADYSGNPNWGGDFVMLTNGVSSIGAEKGINGGGTGDYYQGAVDDLRVYNRTLIPAEIQALYQAATDQPPVLAPVSDHTVVAGQPLVFTLSASDANSPTLAYSATGLPGGATLNATTGAFVWTPSISQTGSYLVTFSVSDGSLSASQPAAITVETAFAAWIASYGVTGPKSLPTADADGSGQNNLFKYVAGLDPTNPASIFLLKIANVTGQPSQKNLIFNPEVSGRTYTPQFRTNLASGAWATLTGIGGPTTNVNQVTLTDLNATQSIKFYRIDISLP